MNNKVSLAFDPTQNVLPAFITPVGRFTLPGHQKLNQVIDAAVTDRIAHLGDKTAAETDWHSDTDFLAWPQAGVRKLAKLVEMGLEHMIRLARQGEDFKGAVAVQGWAQVDRTGVDSEPRHHARCHWAGVYCVKGHGQLILHDPRGSAISMYPHPGARDDGGALRIELESGLLLLFPAWLQYRLGPKADEPYRLTVGLTCNLKTPLERLSPIALA